MANRQRGEVTITLDGKEYVMRPTFEALCEIEDKLDAAIPDLIMLFKDGNIRLKHVAAIVWGGLWGYDKNQAPTFSQVGELISKTGLINILGYGMEDGSNPIVMFMTYGLLGDKSIEEAEKQKEVNKQKGNALVESEEQQPRKIPKARKRVASK